MVDFLERASLPVHPFLMDGARGKGVISALILKGAKMCHRALELVCVSPFMRLFDQ